VVVGIEPFGHLAGRRRFAAGGAAPGHAEQGVQGHRLIVGLLEARRHHAQQAGELKNLVVPGEVAHRHRVQARFRLQRPVALAQAAAHVLQFALLQGAGPIGLDRLFQFTAGADTGKAQVMQGGHDESFVTRRGGRSIGGYCGPPLS
jgi:hypothetical protein